MTLAATPPTLFTFVDALLIFTDHGKDVADMLIETRISILEMGSGIEAQNAPLEKKI